MPEEDLIAARRAKLEALAALGVPGYNVDFRPDVTLAEAAARLRAEEEAASRDGRAFEQGSEVTVAGRVGRLRDQGKSIWLHLEDEDGLLQVWLRRDVLDDRGFAVAGLLDLGDIVGVRGPLFRTRRGEATVLAQSCTPLSKALRPPPEKFHGLSDQELRYRRRHLDLMASPEQRAHFARRTAIIRSLRATLERQGYLEVETPVLQHVAGGATAKPFATHWNALDADVFLRISLELFLKRLLVGGYRRVYEIGRVFRNEGLSPRHNPEYTLLEAYCAYADYGTMRELTETLIVDAANAVGLPPAPEDGGSTPSDNPLVRTLGGRALDLTPPFRTARMVDLIETACGIDVRAAWDAGTLHQHARDIGVEVTEKMSPGVVVQEIYEQCVEHTLWEPTFVLDYPAEVSPLARRRADDPRFVERFELIIAGREIANAFSELNDPIDQRQRFEEQARLRAAGDEEAQPFDEDFIEALESGMPPAGGLGIGVDRLVMLLTDSPAIRDVLLFPTMRARPS
jgi:lysyl-tRNA synthetase class 2